MSNLREAYAGTQFAGLGWSELAEKPIDRVAAAGKVTKISVWDAAYGLSASGLRKMELDLLETARNRWEREQHCQRVVTQAIHEFMFPACQRCQGAGEVMHDQKYVVCPTCEGQKYHKFGDEERSRMMQVSLATTRHLGKKIAWCLSWLGKYDRKSNIEMCIELRS